ncbi:MAG: hypothetical protein JOZ62_17585, partial [Acidobacteriaceae bacterium]|nr:hypothetical protein [Acidobacteriaceae bacterium]
MKRSPIIWLLFCAPFLKATTFTNGQAARAAIGQYSFTFANSTPGIQIIGGAGGLAYARGTLFVADDDVAGGNPNNNRVLMFDTTAIPGPYVDLSTLGVFDGSCNVCGYPAYNVLGQVDFTSTTAGRDQVARSSTQASMSNPTAVASDGNVVAVADTNNNRVLIWRSFPTAINAAPDVVLGQTDFTSFQPPNQVNASSVRGPEGVWIQNGMLFVADTLNYRVLIWRSIPMRNNQPADLVLGQPNFTTVNSPPVGRTSPPTAANQLLNPTSVTSDGTHLVVSDFGFNRVLIWNSIPTVNTQPADVVVGQPDMTTSVPDNPALCGFCEKGLEFPRYALSDGTRLFIADSGNDRVLIFNHIPTANGAAADIVLGQPDFTSDVIAQQSQTILSTSINNQGAVETMPTPFSLAYDGTNLYVADGYNRRVLQFTPGDIALAEKSVLNNASKITRQEGFVTLAGTITANNTVTITVNSRNYTYTVKSNDTLAGVTTALINSINSANSGAGDPDVQALTGTVADTVFLNSRGTNVAFDAISLSASTSSGATISATASGSYLTGGNAGTAAAGAIIEIDNPDGGLADDTISADITTTLPTRLDNVQVFIDGFAAPLYLVSPQQVIAEVPFSSTDRTSSSVYVLNAHRNGGAPTVTTASPITIAPANPGLFTCPTSQPCTSSGGAPAAYGAMHDPDPHPSATISIDGTVQAGDIATITVNGQAYNYTVQSSDSLQSIVTGLVNAINNAPDGNVTAAPGGAFTRVVLRARQQAPAGSGIPVAGSSSPAAGKSAAAVTLTAYTSSTCCSSNATGLLTADNPAQANETIVLLATGLGAVQDASGNAISVTTGVPYDGPQ